MAIWREPALETLVGGPLDASGLTEAAIQGLLTQNVREGEQLDFKLKPHLPPTGQPLGKPGGWRPEQEWAKDVCQFANHRGGLLLIGVDEQDDVAVAAKPTVTDPASLEQRLRVALNNYTAPTPRIEVVAVPSASGDHYLAIVVPPSEHGPHAVTDGSGASRRPFYFPVRDGADARWMDETEVADRYRRRGLSRGDHEAAMTDMVQAGAQQLEVVSDLWLYVAANPESRARTPLDRAMVEQIRNWYSRYAYYSPFERGMYLNPNGYPAPGRVAFTGHHVRAESEVTDPKGGYVELYADGRAFAATPVEFNTADDAGAGRVGLMTLVDDTSILVDVALSWAAFQAGAWGGVDLQAGLMVGGELEHPYPTPLTLHSSSHGDLRRVPNTRLVRRPVRTLVSADLASCGTSQGRMAVVHDVASAVLHHFGFAAVDMIEPDGTVIGSNWGYAEMRQVERWAADRGVAYRDHPA